MKNKFFQTAKLLTLGTFIVVYLAGCASMKSWGTNTTTARETKTLNGKAEIIGKVMMAAKVSNTVGTKPDMNVPETIPINTVLWLQDESINTRSDNKGNFMFKELLPGDYTLSFVNGDRKTQSVKLSLKADESLKVAIYSQSEIPEFDVYTNKYAYPISAPAHIGGRAN